MRILGTLVISLLLLGCSQQPTAPDSMTPDLAAAPSTVVIGGKTLTLSTSLWRDFMPISPPDGKPLGGVLTIRTSDGSAVSADVRADSVWVVFGADMWPAVPREERSRTETAPGYEVIVREGPKWGPDVEVDVIVRLRTADGATYLLSARNQRISGTF
jgi:hypothetical protein